MKRIILALMLSVTVAGVAFANARAVWTDAVTVGNNQIQTGTADLQVSKDGSTWNTTTVDSSMVLTGLIPGSSTSGYSFSLWNASTTGLNFNTSGRISAVSDIGAADPTQLEIAVYEDGATPETGSGWVTLTNWQGVTEKTFSSTLLPGISNYKNYRIAARLTTAADNEWQGKTVIFTLAVTGAQP